MKCCSNCGKELSKPLDEYGPTQAPLCWDCFSDPDRRVDEDKRRSEEPRAKLPEGMLFNS